MKGDERINHAFIVDVAVTTEYLDIDGPIAEKFHLPALTGHIDLRHKCVLSTAPKMVSDARVIKLVEKGQETIEDRRVHLRFPQLRRPFRGRFHGIHQRRPEPSAL